MKETPKNSKIVAAFQAAQKNNPKKTPFSTAYKHLETKKLVLDTDKPGNPALRWMSATGHYVAVLLIDGELSKAYDAQLQKTIGEIEKISHHHQQIIERERDDIKTLLALA